MSLQKYDSADRLATRVVAKAIHISSQVQHLKRVQDFVEAKVTPLREAQAAFIRLSGQNAPVEELAAALTEYSTRRDAYLNDRETRDSLQFLELPTPHVATYLDRYAEFNAIVIRRTAEAFDASDPTGEARLKATAAAFKEKISTADLDPYVVLDRRLTPFGYSALPDLYHRAMAVYATLAGGCSLVVARKHVRDLLLNQRRRKTQGFFGFATPAKIKPLCGGDVVTVTAEDAALVLLLVCHRLLPPATA